MGQSRSADLFVWDHSCDDHALLVLASGGTEIVCVAHGGRRGKLSLDASDGVSSMTDAKTAKIGAANKMIYNVGDWRQNTLCSESRSRERNFQDNCSLSRYASLHARHV